MVADSSRRECDYLLCLLLSIGVSDFVLLMVMGVVANTILGYVYINFFRLHSGKVPICSPHIIRLNFDIERTTRKGDRGVRFR